LPNDDVAGPKALGAVLASDAVAKASPDNVEAARAALLARVEPMTASCPDDDPRDSKAINALADALVAALRLHDAAGRTSALAGMPRQNDAARYLVGRVEDELKKST
jgi:hypothetical protein